MSFHEAGVDFFPGGIQNFCAVAAEVRLNFQDFAAVHQNVGDEGIPVNGIVNGSVFD